MTEAQIHLLRGDDAHGIALWINKFIISLGESFDPSMNLSRLDGNTTNFDNIQLAISTLPFFTGDRLVILENAIEKIYRENPAQTSGPGLQHSTFNEPPRLSATTARYNCW